MLCLAVIAVTKSQEKVTDEIADESAFSFSTNIVNRYVWRGLLYSANPNIQPTIGFAKGNLSLGVWGSYGIAVPYAEVDLYVSYTAGNFTFTINDYYTEDETDLTLHNYFNWDKAKTPHSLEGAVTFNGTESFPISITAATFFYGYDRDANGDNYYSTYFEIGYSKQLGGTLMNLFVGGTPAQGLYHSKAGIVNLGVGLSKEVAITEKFKLPVFTQLVINPSAQDIFFVFGLTL